MDGNNINPIKKQLDEIIKSRQRGSKISIDGFVRSNEEETMLNDIAFSLFSSENGKYFLDYLRSITANRVMPNDISSEQLWYMEGMRALFGIIHKRFEGGRDAR